MCRRVGQSLPEQNPDIPGKRYLDCSLEEFLSNLRKSSPYLFIKKSEEQEKDSSISYSESSDGLCDEENNSSLNVPFVPKLVSENSEINNYINANRYKLNYILLPSLNDEEVTHIVNMYNTLLKNNGARDIDFKIRGKKRLAYPVGGNRDGHYIKVSYISNGQEVAVVERAMRLSKEVIRYLTIKLHLIPTGYH
jgi:small subunit ribosomal protein S6